MIVTLQVTDSTGREFLGVYWEENSKTEHEATATSYVFENLKAEMEDAGLMNFWKNNTIHVTVKTSGNMSRKFVFAKYEGSKLFTIIN